jgi:hypothetical protein
LRLVPSVFFCFKPETTLLLFSASIHRFYGAQQEQCHHLAAVSIAYTDAIGETSIAKSAGRC